MNISSPFLSQLSHKHQNTDACLRLKFTIFPGLDKKCIIAVMDKSKLEELNKSLADKDLCLELSANGLALTDGVLSLVADFKDMLPRLRTGNLQKEMLIKACRIKNLDMPQTVIDATAGLGADSIILAAAGFHVELYESDPIIAALLEDALNRACKDDDLKDIASRMHLHICDSIAAMKDLSEKPDVIVLDPMFPARQKTALIKKKFQLLQKLEQPCSNEEELLAAAKMANPRRIVIKRPIKGPFLAGEKPDYSLEGKAIRYDCLVFARN